MKKITIILVIFCSASISAQTQDLKSEEENRKAIHSLIDQYTQARASKDRALLDYILTSEVDQLVSSGTWRRGKKASMEGMLRSSQRNPGERTITVEHIRFLMSECAIADARYEIMKADGSVRKMWSTFVVVFDNNSWKITAIRNMLPSK